MLKTKDIIDMMQSWAPENLAENWDNVGFQIGDYNKKINRIFLSLDIDKRVVGKAIEGNYDMIITHHPFIFKGVNNINSLSYDGKIILELIKNDIVVYSAHTNLDKSFDGVNEALSNKLGLKATKVLAPLENNMEIGYGKIGYIEEIRLKDYIPELKKKLEVDKVTIYGDVGKLVKKVAVVGGSGSGFIKNAAYEKADIFITGDIKYHDGQEAEKLGLVLIDAGHYHTEKFILDEIRNKLEEIDKTLQVDIYKKPSPLYEIY